MTITPTAEQRKILELGPTSIRVRAGAGTGKTTTVALVIANLVEHHDMAPERILGVTFTNKAAAELARSVANRLPGHLDQSRQVEIHTYHGFAAQVLSEFGPLVGADTRSGVITPTFARQLIREVFYGRSHAHLDITNSQTLDRIRKLGDQMGDHLLLPDDVVRAGAGHGEDETWAARVEMADTLDRYNRAKSQLRVVDYSDLVTLSTRVLQQHPHLSTTIRDRYRVLVLDEYQDTNPAQRILISTIFGDGFPVIAVGDEDQTIYEWRGASAENFENFIDHFKTAAGEPAHDEGLTLNRRSGQQILEVANEVRRKANPSADALQAADDIGTEIVTYWASDALAEAEWIARQFEGLHDNGTPWRDMAILFRKNKDFPILIDALGRHDIPLEVANVGGLLSVPEISFLRAWLTVLQNPEDSTALAQLLLGSTYRLGIADLGVLTRWLTSNVDDDSDTDETHPVTLVEAIEEASRIEDLRPEARERLMRFHGAYRHLLVETQGLNLAETCRLILDRTRAWQDVESLPSSARLTARLNLYRFLDLADDWSPLRGRPSLGAFLDYLSAMEEEPAEELDSARLSGEDAVTLVTVHRAKGLEWENVAIPATVKGNFPSGSGAFPDPIRFAHHLPVELRLDTSLADLPEDESARKTLFRERHKRQEWRVAYVALTRAKRRLFVTGAYWYGLPEPRVTAAEPSELFELVESHPTTRNAGHANVGTRPDILTTNDDGGDPDPLFADGWQRALSIASQDPYRLDQMAEKAGLADAYERIAREWGDRLFTLDETPDEPESAVRDVVSVTGLVTYAQCPKRFYWTDIDPLPRRRNPAAVRGSEIHRRIELHQRGQIPFEDLEPDLYDAVEGSVGRGAYSTYEQSRFASEKAAFVEAPFTFELEGGHRVRGRIDAIYTRGDKWEVVDFKTGRPNTDPARMVQLEAYAVAVDLVDFADRKPEALDVTFAYLGGGLETVTTRADDDWVAKAKTHLEQLTGDIDERRFEPASGEWCRNCDFLRFCEAGLEMVAE